MLLCRYHDRFAEQTGEHFVTIDRGRELLGKRSVTMVAVLSAGVVLVRDYASPRKLRAVRVDDTDGPIRADIMAHLEMDAACVVCELVTLRYGRGVGVVCYGADDLECMSLVGERGNHTGRVGALVAKCLHPWHRCPDDHVVDVTGPEREPWLVSGGGTWRTGRRGVAGAVGQGCGVGAACVVAWWLSRATGANTCPRDPRSCIRAWRAGLAFYIINYSTTYLAYQSPTKRPNPRTFFAPSGSSVIICRTCLSLNNCLPKGTLRS